MKKIFTAITALILTISLFAQAPDKMSYQAVVKDTDNSLVTSQSVGIQISILQGSPSGTSVYVESQTPNTNSNGLLSLEIGTGNVVNGDFTTIEWGSDTYFIQTEIDPTGGTDYTITGVSQLMSVPYALHAKMADNGITLAQTNAMTSNSAKVGLTPEQIATLNNTSGNNTGDQDISGIRLNANAISLNTVKETIPSGSNTGDMNYWNGTSWVIIPTTVYEGATLQMINGVPTWTGGTPPPPPAIGQPYLGGILAYILQSGDSGYDENVPHGLIVPPTDQSTGIIWHATNDGETGASGHDLGTGQANTNAIVNLYGNEINAAKICDDLILGGYSDWFLPSHRELQYILRGASKFGWISHTTNTYWSSTESTSNEAFFAISAPLGGTVPVSSKNNSKSVRAIRSF